MRHTMYLRGLVALQRGNIQGGIESITAAISHDGRQPAYHNHLGEAYRAAGNLAAAKACFQRALAQWPQSAELHNNLGSTLHALSEHKLERSEFEDAVRLRPDFAQAHHNLGIALQVEGRFDEAAESHRRALQIEPRLAAAIGALGYALQETGNLEEAATEYRRYLQLAPHDAKVQENLATVLRMLRRFEEAETEYDLLIESAGPSLERLVFLGECVQSLGKLTKAIDCYRQAVALDPTRPEPHFRLGTALLAAGDYAEGWPEYEWQLKPFSRYRSLPAWDGSPLNGESIVLFGQAGLGYGDVLQFVRYAALVSQRGGDVVLDVDKSLVRLLLQSGFREVVATGTTIHPPCAYHAAIMSLPRISWCKPRLHSRRRSLSARRIRFRRRLAPAAATIRRFQNRNSLARQPGRRSRRAGDPARGVRGRGSRAGRSIVQPTSGAGGQGPGTRRSGIGP